jgi:hypothetical protein
MFYFTNAAVTLMEWRPATISFVRGLINADLEKCDSEQFAAFQKYGVEPYLARIVRYGRTEKVVVVARRGHEVMYWEDVEEGFNISPVNEVSEVLEHWCNQDDLRLTLNAWIEGRTGPPRLGPALPIANPRK